MASFWDMLGKAAGVMQLTGVDALGMVSMIVQAARTARRNRNLCQQLAKKVEIVSGLLEELNILELRRHRKTRRPLDELRMALCRGYVLVWSCSQQQQNASQIRKMFMAADVAAMLRQAKDEIDSYIILIPLITTVASIRARESESNEAAPARRRPQLSIQEVAHSPSSSSQDVSHSLELEKKQPSWSTSVCLQNYEPSQTSSQSSHASASNWEQERLSELVLMMVHSADTARYNRDPCQQLARQAVIVSNQLQGPLGARRLRLEQLEDLLFRGYMLICFCSQYSRRQLRLVFTGADVASVFQLAQQEIGRQIYHFTSRVPAQQEDDEDVANNSAQDQWSPLSIYRKWLSTATTSMDKPTLSSQADRASRGPVITVDSVEFSFEELYNATEGFSMSYKIGQGGCGAVYYAELRGEKAAIKKMDMQASDEFIAELKVLTHVHHLNLVRLIGFCTESSLFLIYEFIENGNLSQHLRGTGYEPLTWAARVQIALDSARGLEYIHEHTVPMYIHRDIKSGNILIDKNYRAKVSDFGLTKLAKVGNTSLPTRGNISLLTRGIVGTFGYMAPEYAWYGDVSPRVDVYAFGVVLYELISAKEAIVRSTESFTDSKGLVYLFEEALNTLDPKEGLQRLIDPALGKDYPIESILKMAMLARACTQEDPKARPTMRSIVVALMTLSSTSEFWDMNAIQENQGLVNLMSGR